MTYSEAVKIVSFGRHAPATYDLAERILRDSKRNRLADKAASLAVDARRIFELTKNVESKTEV